MHKHFFLSGILLIFNCALFAQPTEKSDFNHQFSIAIEHAHYLYQEPDIYQSFVNADDRKWGAIWMNYKGNLWGGSASYLLTWQDRLFLQSEARLLYGKTGYSTGHKEILTYYTKKEAPTLIFEPRLTIGWNFLAHKNITISPYSGIAYRFKSDDGEDVKLCNDSRKLESYRKSNYVYVPLGASVEYRFDNAWSVSLKGEYDWIVKAWQYDRTIGDPTLSFKQPNGYGLKGEASMSYLYNKIKFSLTPYINYWNIRNSKRKHFMHDGYQASAREPYNITWETGLKLGITF